MGFASYHEDNLDARGESVRGRHRRLTLSKEKTKKTQRKKTMESQFTLGRRSDSTRTPRPKQSLKLLRQKALYNTRQDIHRRELQKTQYVTTEEIERRIQREIIRQSRLKE